MNVKAARAARQVKRLADGNPDAKHTRKQRSELKRAWHAMNHRERGVRRGHWNAMVNHAREVRQVEQAEAEKDRIDEEFERMLEDQP